MHQTPRLGPRSSSPASSPATNPLRTNNPRESTRTEGRQGTGGNASLSETSNTAGMTGEVPEKSGPSRDSVKKLDQIIQNIFAKAATVILQERMKVTPILVGKNQERRTSRWFQLDTDDIEESREAFRAWKQVGGFDNRPSPMVIECYLDTSKLRPSQSVVVIDDNGKRWDVVEALGALDHSGDSSGSGHGKSNTQLIMERWRIELKGSPPDEPEDFGPLLPTVYKKAIVLMRSLYTATGFLPTRRLSKNSRTKGVHPALQVRCRVYAGATQSSGIDTLRAPLYEGDLQTDFMFGNLEVPVGRFYLSVAHRNNCDFQVVDSESLLSSRIGMAISDDMFKPSLPQRDDSRRSPSIAVGSLPHQRYTGDITDNQQRYGSLSTFHGEGPLGTSPISALKQIKAPGSDTSSPTDSRPGSLEAPPHSLPISGPARPQLRGIDGKGRRPSVSFQPFKQGSLSGSSVPKVQETEAPASPSSLSRGSVLAHTRNRSSLTAGMPASLRGPAAAVDSPLAASPKPSGSGRFSSSFSHRRNRASFGGTSRAGDEDQNSSGRQSLASSVAQPGSGLLNEAGAIGSSGSLQTDDDNIQEFLKALESKRTLQSFEPSKKGDASTKKTARQLSKFQMMKDSNNLLTESLNSSAQLQRSSSSSSRQLGNVPGMSTSSSPGKPLSPHTPHTPAVPSRLSENSSADPTAPITAASRRRTESATSSEVAIRAPNTTLDGITPIDIPLSPRQYPHGRRSSSVTQQARISVDDDDADTRRSTSLGVEDREPPSLSALLNLDEAPDDNSEISVQQPSADVRSVEASEQASSSIERETRPPGGLFVASSYSSSPYGRRYGSSAGRGVTPPQSGNSSISGPQGSRHVRPPARGGATALSVASGHSEEPEEEPLLFDMSELGRDASRRSIEEGRGAGGLGGDRGGYDPTRSRTRW